MSDNDSGYSRVSPDEMVERVNLVVSLFEKGMTQRSIIQYIEEKTDWGISKRQARRICAKARDMLVDEAMMVSRPEHFGLVVRWLKSLFEEARKMRDVKEARQVAMSLAKLLRLDQPSFEMDWRKVAEENDLEAEEVIAAVTEMLRDLREQKRRQADEALDDE